MDISLGGELLQKVRSRRPGWSSACSELGIKDHLRDEDTKDGHGGRTDDGNLPGGFLR
jgi:hypothetical protein